MLFSTCVKRSALLSAVVRKQIIGLGSKRTGFFFCIPVIKNATTPSTLVSSNSIRSFNTTKMKLQEEKPHDHARLWVIEKATSAILVVLIPFGLLIPNRLFDSLLAILITAHTFWGMEAVMVEYVRVLLFGPLIPKIAIGFVYAMTVLMLGGLFYLIFNDIGLCRAFWRIWRNMRKPRDSFKRR
ncbi:succinate dehydrogenase [ubiquinone] cytochrome b small subunit, mitochondrial-like [Vanessa cardui]|uniref:succinate dehydrogenase [ubiquinone] cytochrome b small subunit, mitochondrial-like n=1 Tax=Vanessa cardui TaxID=171605 RepID=UPI001F139054|nr:succinate dehydrogenase [ubiquinone] cytochrome b small subunit, mitochondrial-like [Vanessa cardui]